MSTFLLSKKFFLWGAPALAVAAAPTLPAGGVADSPATVTTVTPHSTDEAGPLEAQHRLDTFKTWIIEHPEFAAAGYMEQIKSLSLIGFDLEAVSTLRVDNGPVELIGSFVEPAPAAQRGDLASLAGANGAQSVEDVERIVREAVGVEVKVVEGGATPARSRAADTIGRSFNATLVTS